MDNDRAAQGAAHDPLFTESAGPFSSIRRALSGKLDRIAATARFRYACLYRSYQCSAPRILLGELRIAVLRTTEIIRSSAIRQGVGISPCPVGIGDQGRRRYKNACIQIIERISAEFRWLGLLDVRLIGEAFRDGASLSCCTCCTVSASGVSSSSGDYAPEDRADV